MAQVKRLALPKGTALQGQQTYRIIRPLGEGGFGITYEAEGDVMVGNIKHTVRFTLKEFFQKTVCQRDPQTFQITPVAGEEQTFADSRADFLKEAERMRDVCQHPAIVSVNEVFEQYGTVYYVMEFIEGPALQDFVAKGGAPLTEEMALKIIRPVAEALRFLHSHHMNHLDVKPENIMLRTLSDGSVSPVLIDFGLSKHYTASGRPTSDKGADGYSEGYCPLEQYAGIYQFAPEADVYALAATLCYMLTGKTPPGAAQMNDTVLDTTLPAATSATTRQALKRAMQKLYTDRCRSMGAFLALLDGQPEDDNYGLAVADTDGGSETQTVSRSSRISRQELTETAFVPRGKKRGAVTSGPLPWKVISGVAAGVVVVAGIVLALTIGGGDDKPVPVQEPVAEVKTQPEAADNLQPQSPDGRLLARWADGATEQQRKAIMQLLSQMVFVAEGRFNMGLATASQYMTDATPVHEVKLSAYHIARCEVTQQLWQAVMGTNPSTYTGADLPVENVSYTDCVDFIARLNTLCSLQFALPTEAQWEYACRGGGSSRSTQYSGGNAIDLVAWHIGNAGGETHAVGKKDGNELGLYDMTGNVREFCADLKAPYKEKTESDPLVLSGNGRVVRGGSWGDKDIFCHVAYRSTVTDDYRSPTLGLRLVHDPDRAKKVEQAGKKGGRTEKENTKPAANKTQQTKTVSNKAELDNSINSARAKVKAPKEKEEDMSSPENLENIVRDMQERMNNKVD